MKESIIKIVRDLIGFEYLYFNSPLLIKLTPHTWPPAIWGICASPSDQIYLMDNTKRWHELKTSDVNYDKVLSTLYQRMKTIEKLKLA